MNDIYRSCTDRLRFNNIALMENVILKCIRFGCVTQNFGCSSESDECTKQIFYKLEMNQKEDCRFRRTKCGDR